MRRSFPFVIASGLLIILSGWVLFHLVYSFDDNFAFSTETVLHDLQSFLLDPGNSTAALWSHASLNSMSSEMLHTGMKVCHDPQTKLASSVYVVSLPNRIDRRTSMERLRAALNVKWTYEDATPSDHPKIQTLLQNLASYRRNHQRLPEGIRQSHFIWPTNFDATGNLSSSASQQKQSEQPREFPPDLSPNIVENPSSSISTYSRTPSTDLIALKHPVSLELHDPITPLTCATKDTILGVPYSLNLSSHMILTPAKLACWYSHVQLLSRIAGSTSHEDYTPESTLSTCVDVTLVLEDDVDMERDILKYLTIAWETLPENWDILFIGLPFYWLDLDNILTTISNRALLVRRNAFRSCTCEYGKPIQFIAQYHQIEEPNYCSPILRSQMHSRVCAAPCRCP